MWWSSLQNPQYVISLSEIHTPPLFGSCTLGISSQWRRRFGRRYISTLKMQFTHAQDILRINREWYHCISFSVHSHNLSAIPALYSVSACHFSFQFSHAHSLTRIFLAEKNLSARIVWRLYILNIQASTVVTSDKIVFPLASFQEQPHYWKIAWNSLCAKWSVRLAI